MKPHTPRASKNKTRRRRSLKRTQIELWVPRPHGLEARHQNCQDGTAAPEMHHLGAHPSVEAASLRAQLRFLRTPMCLPYCSTAVLPAKLPMPLVWARFAACGQDGSAQKPSPNVARPRHSAQTTFAQLTCVSWISGPPKRKARDCKVPGSLACQL